MALSRPLLIATCSALLVAAAVFAIYWVGLHGGFFFDDGPNILQVDGLRLETLSFESLRQAIGSGSSGPSGRPVSQLSFALNYYFSGFDPFVFKLTNLAIHAANGILVLLLAFRLVGTTGPKISERERQIAAGLVVIVWLLHPIQVLSVLHVVQRMTSLSAFFLFAALLLHVHARERDGHSAMGAQVFAWGVLWPLSFFSKETGALFPVFVLAYELIIRRTARGGLDAFARVLTWAVFVAGIGAAIYAFSPLGQWLWAGYDMRPFSLLERQLTEGRALWFYLGLILLPRLDAFGLYHDDIIISHGLLEPWTTLFALAGLAGLLWLVWLARRRAPLVAFGIAWFFIGHGLESSILPLEIAHEHRNYVPLFGLLLPVAWGLARMTESVGPRRTLGVTIALVTIAYPACITALRSHQFGDEVRRTQIEAQHHRESAQAHYEAGRALVRRLGSQQADSPAHFFARRHFERASDLDPDFKLGWLGLIYQSCLHGKAAEPSWIEELSRRLRETPFAPGDRTVLYNLKEMAIAGELCLGRPDVERIFGAALANRTAAAPVRAMLHSWQADYLTLVARDLPAAQAELDRSLVIVPGNPSNRLKRAQLAYLQGQPEEARSMLHSLHGASLSRTERTTLKELDACLHARDDSINCVRH